MLYHSPTLRIRAGSLFTLMAYASFRSRFLAANRVLTDLDAIDEFRSLSLTSLNTIREAQQVLADLLEHRPDALTPDQAKSLQGVIDRLGVRLAAFRRRI
jgi:hypothetical protein